MSRYTVHIFNPETEYALGSGTEYYTPPASIIRLRRSMSLLPALWASPGDTILLLDDIRAGELATLPYFDIAVSRQIYIMPSDAEFDASQRPRIRPWGWNVAIRQRLLRMGVDEQLLPSLARVESIRTLAHRRYTRRMLRHIGMAQIRLPIELSDSDSVMEWCACHPGGYLKTPWSSSGRGIYRVLRPDGEDIRGWVKGVIRRQGSVMVEDAWQRVADFATEWWVHSGGVRFLGYSLFEVDDHSQYRRNISLSQPQIEHRLRTLGWSDDILQRQCLALKELVAPYYSGPIGLDCLADDCGNIHPCVEMNVRMTMGLAHILSSSRGCRRLDRS